MKKVTILLILFTVISHVNAQFFSGTENTTSTIHRGGKVGIGTSNPQLKLHISDTDRVGIQIGGPSTSTGAVGDISFRPGDFGSVNGAKLWNLSFRTNTWSGNKGDFVIFSSDGNSYISPLILQSDGDVVLVDGASAGRKGNVGIGTLNPSEKLTVNGTILASKVVIVDASEIPQSDYVFDAGYNLRSLEEVENFVKENKHLPEVPSAAEFKENGYSVGTMDDILLRKVEELTLYIIEQQKTINALQTEVGSLKTK